MEPKRPILIGISGGIASGKSFVTEQLKHKGAAVISADEAAHDVLKLDDVKRAARERWGETIFTADGEIDRAAVGKIVFAREPDASQELKFLEQLTHPRIGEVIRHKLAQLQAPPTPPAIVLDVPLLIESGWNKFCDKIVYVDASHAVREARAAARGWSPQEFASREASQHSLDSKRAAAHVLIDNSGSAEHTAAQVDRFWREHVEPEAHAAR